MKKHFLSSNSIGFTLIELLVVLIILGILISVAIPKFSTGTEAARVVEAKTILGAIRESEMTHVNKYGIYTTNFTDMGLEGPKFTVTTPAVANSQYWDFSITLIAAPADFTAQAVRRALSATTVVLGSNICTNVSGTTWGNHPYAISPT